MLTIHHPEIVRLQGKSRLTADLEFDGARKPLWFEVDGEYEKYLCFERSDAFLVAVLPYAMRKGYDITCAAPVTGELLYSINEHLLPALCKSEKAFHKPSITAECTDELLPNYGGVGTGMSCGVDSFHSVAGHLSPPKGYPKLTHLCIFNNGSFAVYENKPYGHDRVKAEIVERAGQVADLLNLPLIEADSNIREVLFLDYRLYYQRVYTYNSIFGVLSMQKLWKTYLFSSTYEYVNFNFNHNDAASYDLLSLTCFSTRQLRFFSEGGPFDRSEKFSVVADFAVAQKYLHVCFFKGYNCGVCMKCRRTLMALDVSGCLDKFKEAFPVDYYRANINDYFTMLTKDVFNNDLLALPIYNHMMKQENYTDRLQKIKAKMESVPTQFNTNYKTITSTAFSDCMCVMDSDTGDVLYEKNADNPENPGHTAAIVACLVALEQGSLDKIYALPNVNRFGITSVMDYMPGEKMTLRDMLYGMMLPSYTDLSEAVAICVSGSVAAFAEEMNLLAKRMGMVSSNFSSPHCVTDAEDKTTARDMALAMKYALKNPIFKEIVSAPVYTAKTSHKEYVFESINELLVHRSKENPDLRYPLSIGGQTGRVDGRYTFVSAAYKDGRTNIVSQLGMSNVYGFPLDCAYRFADAALLHEWAFAQSG